MFVPLSSLTDRKGDRMNGVMNHRRGGGLRKMIRRTDPLITISDCSFPDAFGVSFAKIVVLCCRPKFFQRISRLFLLEPTLPYLTRLYSDG